jgi:maltooligosyltrehalose trehalohydrolase
MPQDVASITQATLAHASMSRRLPIGAEVLPDGGVHFRVWAPRCTRVDVVLEDGDGTVLSLCIPLEPEAGGYFSAMAAEARAGMRYRYALDGQEIAYPDPASRFQPEGPHGPSQVIDPSTFPWTDRMWQGLCLEGQVIYEMHIGTFTRAGTWAAATAELPVLAATGITVIEIMPVADFVGRFGWGYDGVNLFAPTRLYGTPDDFRRFVNEAHGLGMGVILDVVYNHLGPDGNYLSCFAADYFTDRYQTDWGQAINFDGDRAEPVRAYFLANASYWIDEFHLDGFRFDATQNIYDASADHILAAIVRQVRHAARGRSLIFIAENEPQNVKLVQAPEQNGYGLDALWNDDFHHSAMALLSGHREAYYTDYRGTPQEFISASKWGFLYQGQWYSWQKQRRGTPAFGLKPATFVLFIQNHDQVANSARSQRCHTFCSPGRYRTMTALMLLAPGTPMLFQGQEFAASSPFFYFADHKSELAEQVHQGRQQFMRQFRTLSMAENPVTPPNPADPATFERCKLDLTERQRHVETYALHCDLLQLRRTDPVFRAQRPGRVDGAVLASEAFVLRFFADDGDDRLLIVNFGLDYHLNPAPEPLLAPPLNNVWQIMWSSEDPRYGGDGTAPLETEDNWHLPGQAAVVLAPTSEAERQPSS